MPAITPGAASGSALSAASPEITTSWRAPLEPSMMVTVFCSPAAGCLAADFALGPGCGAKPWRLLFCRGRRLADRDVGDRLAAQRIVVEDGKADEGNQEQAEQHGERLEAA